MTTEDRPMTPRTQPAVEAVEQLIDDAHMTPAAQTSEPRISRDQVRLDPETDAIDAFIGGYKNGWHAARLTAQPATPDVVGLDWDELILDALRQSDGGNNPFYADDPDTVSLAREIADAVRAAFRLPEAAALPAAPDDEYDSMADYEEHMAALGDPDLPAAPAGLPSGERLYRVFWAVRWEGGAYPNQWEQLTPRQQETWDQIAAVYAEGEPDHD